MRPDSFPFILSAFFALLVFFQTGEARAHRMLVFARLENGQVIVEGAFAKGAPCRNCKVRATDMKGETVFSGKTDDSGQCRFSSPSIPQDLEIRLDAGLGHMAKTRLTAREQTDSPPGTSKAKPKSGAPGHATASANPETHVEDAFHPLSRKEIEEFVAREVARRFEDIEKRRETSDKERLQIRPGEIVGGLGFIFGLFALVLAARKSFKV